MERSPHLYLSEIRSVTTYLLTRTSTTSREDYLSNRDLQFIVERGFILIGEGMVLLKRYYPLLYEELHAHDAAIGFRNFIVHQYWNIDNRAVWDTLIVNVPALDHAIDILLSRLDSPE